MRYGELCRTCAIPPRLIADVEKAVGDTARTPAVAVDSGGVRRSSRVVWVEDAGIRAGFFDVALYINREARWNFQIDELEPLQYTEYWGGDEYGWHVDQYNKPHTDQRVRKFSFSAFLNDDYEGGAFDLEVHGPGQAVRYATFDRPQPGSALFFLADLWHRVRPVTKGMRKSLVGWVLGPPFR